MRLALLALAASSLVLAGCGKKEAAGNSAALDEQVSAADFATNDTTAIDAATGADANMAADVDINAVENIAEGNRSNTRPAASKPRSAPPSNASTEAPAAEPIEPVTQPAESNNG